MNEGRKDKTRQVVSGPTAAMPVVILCGGQGTRLREHTDNVPKPMVEIGEQPILWHIMKLYGMRGFRRFILCLGYKGWVIKQYFLRYHEMRRDFTVSMKGDPPEVRFHNQMGEEDWQVTCAETGADSGTGGRLKLVESYVDAEDFCFTYGDAVGTVDLDALLAFHRAQGRIATVTGVHPTSRYGEMKVDGGKVVEFNEKPTVAEGVVSGGFFVFNRRVFDYLGSDPKIFLELEPLQKLARDGELSVFVHEGFWHPMDTYRDWLHLNELWKSGRAPVESLGVTPDDAPDLSLVIPLYNEAENLPVLAAEIRRALEPTGKRWESLFVDDGSTDGSFEVLQALAAEDRTVRILRHRKNAGQSAALAAGFAAARGAIVVTLDADLQNDPADIPALLARLGESAATSDCDAVSGVRQKRRDSWVRRISSRVANSVRNWATDEQVSDVGCSLKAYRREVLERLPMFTGMHRFLPTLVRWNGARLAEIPVNHRPRLHGTAKYGIGNRLFRALADLMAVRWMRTRWIPRGNLEVVEEIAERPR